MNACLFSRYSIYDSWLYKWILTRYIFLADKVEIQDITNQTSLLVLVGPKSNQVK